MVYQKFGSFETNFFFQAEWNQFFKLYDESCVYVAD